MVETNEKTAVTGNALYQNASAAMRRRADRRLQIIQDWQAFRKKTGYGNIVAQDNDFIAAWNLQNPQETISRQSIHRWAKSYKENGLDGLIEKYDRKPHRQSSFDAAAQSYLEALYLDQARRDMHSCYQNLLVVAKKEGWQVPSFSTCRRHLQKLSRDVVTYLREGSKAFHDKAFPAIQRDPDSLQVGECYVADDRMADVSYGEGRAGDRIWVTVWMDIRSRKVMSVVCSLDGNNAQAVLDGFYHAAMQHIPNEIYLDNGGNYREAAYISKEQAEQLPPALQAPLAKLLGENKIHWAFPGNARAKIVEHEAFAHMARLHDKNLPGYTGMNVLSRPEGWYISRERGEFFSRETVVSYIKQYFFEKHNNWGPNGKKSPNEIWAEYFSKNAYRRANPEYLRHLLLRTWPKPIQLRTNGIQFGKDHKGRNCFYWDEFLQMLTGNIKEVWIKYNQNEPEHIWIYRLDGTPLCELPLSPFSGIPILRGGERVSKYQATKRRRVKEIQARKKQLDDLHKLNMVDPEKLMQRADIRPEPKTNFDQNTGEVFERVDELLLDMTLPMPSKQTQKLAERKKKLLRQAEENMPVLAPAHIDTNRAWSMLDEVL